VQAVNDKKEKLSVFPVVKNEPGVKVARGGKNLKVKPRVRSHPNPCSEGKHHLTELINRRLSEKLWSKVLLVKRRDKKGTSLRSIKRFGVFVVGRARKANRRPPFRLGSRGQRRGLTKTGAKGTARNTKIPSLMQELVPGRKGAICHFSQHSKGNIEGQRLGLPDPENREQDHSDGVYALLEGG